MKELKERKARLESLLDRAFLDLENAWDRFEVLFKLPPIDLEEEKGLLKEVIEINLKILELKKKLEEVDGKGKSAKDSEILKILDEKARRQEELKRKGSSPAEKARKAAIARRKRAGRLTEEEIEEIKEDEKER